MKNFYLLAISAVFICGVFLASYGVFASFSLTFIFIFSLVLFLLCALLIKTNSLFTVFLFVLAFILGIIRYETFNLIDKSNITNFVFYTGKKVLVKGEIKSDPTESRAGRKKAFVLEVHSVKLLNRRERADGFLLVNLYTDREVSYRYGDIVVLEGILRKPFSYGRKSRFDYGKYLANKRIYTILSVKKGFSSEVIGEDKRIAAQIVRAAYSARAKLESRIEEFLKSPYSSILAAVLLGKREKIPPWLKDLFAKTGTLHILAISGLHVGIIYFALRVILKIFRIPQKPSVILSVLFLAFFAILAGGRPSILRAAVMFSILAFGEMLKRKISVFNLLGLSCLVILITCPNQVFDLGFIFSYTAVLSIVCFSPLFYRVFSVGDALGRACALPRKIKYYTLRSVSVSLAAWLGLLPLLAYYFGLISPVVVIANLVVIPLVFMVMGSGLFFLTLGGLSQFLASVFAQSVWFFLFLLIKSVEALKNVPFAYFEIKPPNIYSVILYYIALFLVLLVYRRKKLTFFFLT
ncbi:MAG: ComEC/Rec2 family competence protein [Candidatus Omnitrophota bacterium]